MEWLRALQGEVPPPPWTPEMSMCAFGVCLGRASSSVVALMSAAAHGGFPSTPARGKLSRLSPSSTHVPAELTLRCGAGGRLLSPNSKQHQQQLLCSFLPGLFACVSCVPRCMRRRERGRVSSPVPACTVTLLLQRLQDQEGDRAQAYRELESALWEDNSRPPCGVVNRLLGEVSQDLTAAQLRGHSRRQREQPAHAGIVLVDGGGLALPRASGSLLDRVSPEILFQGITGNGRTAASNVLVALARMHFSLVMAELQSCMSQYCGGESGDEGVGKTCLPTESEPISFWTWGYGEGERKGPKLDTELEVQPHQS
ncbi:uncharacterized protein LOC122178333 [Lagopus leucura]|uniref:uncharacterized protein LOC122178333 n=1 Tax=Lagopus leucura TaxID=30410 RepID=UPI001C6674A5|nr:uncharacterized protein LOC122178333 [Lagopus leucura]